MENYLNPVLAGHEAPFLSGASPLSNKAMPAWPTYFLGQSTRPTRVLLVDDDVHVRRVIADELLADPRIHLVAQGGSLKEGKHLVTMGDFDVLLVDLNLGDGLGFDLIRHAKAVKPLAEVVLISVMEDEDHALHAFELGATGYFVKHSWFGNFPDAVLQVVNGGASITPSLARRLLKKLDYGRAQTDAAKPASSTNNDMFLLSDREREVLKLVAAGYVSDEISNMLHISVQTVNTHIKNTHRKLNVRTRAQAVKLAAQSGLL
jgi:DNA-binding NarL/FixJ family response regulator